MSDSVCALAVRRRPARPAPSWPRPRPVGALPGTAWTSVAGDGRPRGRRDPGPDGPSDAHLLRAHLDGDPQSFDELVRRHRTLLRVVALRVLENHHDADDAVQDGLIRAFRGAHTYAGRSSVGAWLRTIVENTARTAARTRSRDRSRSAGVPDPRDVVDTSAMGVDPAEEVIARTAVAEALAQIPAPWRHTFELVKVNGLSYAEAAAVLGVPLGTVRSRINRANAARAHRRSAHRVGGPVR